MKKTLLKFSIVTPSYNQGHFIEQTITSVLSQQYPALQYVIIDGGSTDSTIGVLKRYTKYLHWISEPDHGQTEAINKGLRLCKGDIVAYINSDDYYLPDALEVVAKYFASHPNAMWLVGDARIVDKDGQETHNLIRWYKKILRICFFPMLLTILNPIPQPSVFIRASALRKLGFFDESLKFTMDYEYWLRLQNACGNPLFIPETLSAFRIHGDSKGGTAYKKQFAEERSVAARYTKNTLLLWLHELHNHCILSAYSILKRAQ